MRWAIVGLAVLAVGCSRPEPGGDHQRMSDVAESGPNIGVNRAPGVSLSYNYAFRLPIQRIVSVQEEHASQCEALSAMRCRITGMTYSVGRDRRISASLAVKLAPEIARHFGKQAVDTVIKRGGMLSDAQIDSEESGAAINAVDRDAAAIKAEQERIVAQLAKPGLSSAERTQLQSRLAELAVEERQSQSVRGEAALKLASTPMMFTYRSGDVDPGLSDGPILGAIKDGWANIVAGIAMILTVLITLIPWIVTSAIFVWLWRRFGARLANPRGSGEDPS